MSRCSLCIWTFLYAYSIIIVIHQDIFTLDSISSFHLISQPHIFYQNPKQEIDNPLVKARLNKQSKYDKNSHYPSEIRETIKKQQV